ncbi:MAG: O-antigen ligase family protein [Acidimicrobiales bacterium]
MLRTVARPGAVLPGTAELVTRLRSPLAWLVVPAVALFLRYEPERLQLGVRALALAGVVAVAFRRPDLGVLSLVVGLPFQLVALSFLYAHGVSAVVVRPMGLWKEAVVAGCALAAVRAWRAAGDRADAIDWAAGAYVAIVLLYYAAPRLLVAQTGAAAPPTDRLTLNVALRTETIFVILLVAVRHLDLGPDFRDRFARTVFATGVAVAAIGTFELAFSDRWNDLMVTTFQVPRYKLDVLNVESINPLDIRMAAYNFGGRQGVRIGAVFLDQLQCGLWLVTPFAVGVHRLLRSRGTVFAAVGTATITLALVGTQTRAALLAAAVAVLCLLRPHAGVSRAARVRVVALLGAGAAALAPVAVATGLVDRAVGGTAGDGGSTGVHLQRSKAALETFIEHPFGRGLGTGANLAERFRVQSRMFSENYYLQVANETGVISVVLFVILVLVVAKRLGAHRHDGDVLAAAWRSAFLGLAVASILLHVWENITVAWPVWIGVGLILGVGPDPAQPPAVGDEAAQPAISR